MTKESLSRREVFGVAVEGGGEVLVEVSQGDEVFFMLIGNSMGFDDEFPAQWERRYETFEEFWSDFEERRDWIMYSLTYVDQAYESIVAEALQKVRYRDWRATEKSDMRERRFFKWCKMVDITTGLRPSLPGLIRIDVVGVEPRELCFFDLDYEAIPNVRQLLNVIYNTALSTTLPPYTYDERWSLYNLRQKRGVRLSARSLDRAEVHPGDVLVVRLRRA